ncbi:protease [Halostagnicola sp. A56]|uniref:rhomboid family intramembrane serine protease n=1 Tax=Halostagnicola sp. A56 TaxID=1495067 RepID=UPI0004A03299|nr:rhomboid family intramembrane serine protease [Halostagnicola sp. A56]KDE58700.1 protease [Halostagnicola sp. A56]
MNPIGAALGVVLAATFVGSIAAIKNVHDPERPWGDVLRSRFVYGVPWGTVLVLAFVLAFYLFVQDGISQFSDPVSIPYRAYSYYYPLGMLSASFAHASAGHLLSNVFGAAVVAPIAEYAWGHYPNGRDSREHDTNGHDSNTPDERSSRTLWRTPWVRAVVIFPLAVIALGIVTSLLALGPVIGFSGIVFAFAGFAIVRYPIPTILAVLGGQTVLMTTYDALSTPIGLYVPQASPATAPSWANVAIQGHALGFFAGFVLAAVLCKRRQYRPNPLYLWIAVLFFAFEQGLWKIYWYGDQNSFYLFQGPGIAIVTGLALIVTLAITAPDRPALPASIRERFARSADAKRDIRAEARTDRILELAGSSRSSTRDAIERVETMARGVGPSRSKSFAAISERRVAFLVIVAVVALIAGPAIPTNLFVISGETGSEDASISVADYTIEYVDGAENEIVGVVDVGAFGQDTSVESSGVIVSSEKRHLWQESITAQQLAFTGEETVSVGGPGWRETVRAERTGWTPTGSDPVYQIWLSEDEGDEQLAFTSESSQADVRVDDRTITVDTDGEAFVLEVARTDADGDPIGTSTVDVPERNETVRAGGIEFEREEGAIYAKTDGTVVQVASEEKYSRTR